MPPAALRWHIPEERLVAIQNIGGILLLVVRNTFRRPSDSTYCRHRPHSLSAGTYTDMCIVDLSDLVAGLLRLLSLPVVPMVLDEVVLLHCSP